MRLLSVTGLLLGLATGLSAVTAQELIDGSDAEAILAIAQRHGEAALSTQSSGAPLISGSVGERAYHLFFMNCGETGTCEDLNFYAGFLGVKPTLDALNEWNRNRRFGNAYLDADLDAVIEFDLNLEYGVTADNLDAAFSLWSLLLEEFTLQIVEAAR